MEVSRLETILLQLNAEVCWRRQLLQACCDSCQTLFKPWPAKKKEKNKETNGEENHPENPKEKASLEVSTEELAALSLVDKLLTKAQKARTVQKKGSHVGKQEPERPSKSKARREINVLDETTPALEEKDQLLHALSRVAAPGGEKKGVPDVMNQKQKLPPVSCQSAQPEPALPDGTGRSASHQASAGPSFRKVPSLRPISARTSRGGQSMPAKGSSDPPSASSLSSSARSARPPSSTRRQGPRPAHMSAPFKTDPNVRMPCRQKNPPPKSTRGRQPSQPEVLRGQRKSLANNGGSRSRQFEKNSFPDEDRVDFPPVVILGDGTVLDGTEAPAAAPEDDVNDDRDAVQANSQDSNLCANGDSSKTAGEDASVNCSVRRGREFKSEVQDCHAVSDTKSQNKTDNAAAVNVDPETEDQPQKPFLLQKDGKTLSIPIKLRRLYANGCQLRAKLRAAAMTRKVDETDMGRAFAARLEEEMEVEAALHTQRGYLQCLREHTSLLELLQSLQLQTLSERSSPEDIYRSKLLVEYILTQFNELQHEAEQYTKGNPVTALGDDLTEVELVDTRNPSQWFQSNPNQKERGCPSSLTYQSCRQLQHWMHLQFQQQLASFHASLVDLVTKHLLPLLTATEPHSREYISIFRAVFSFLTSQGQHLPAVVATDS